MSNKWQEQQISKFLKIAKVAGKSDEFIQRGISAIERAAKKKQARIEKLQNKPHSIKN